MSRSIKTLQDSLAYILQGLLYCETQISNGYKSSRNHITSLDVRAVLEAYMENTENARLMLDQVFDHLLVEPVARKNNVVNKLVEETQELLTCTFTPNLRNILMIGCLKNISAYKIANYQTAYFLSAELELEAATDLLYQLLDAEQEATKGLDELSIKEFNKIHNQIHLN